MKKDYINSNAKKDLQLGQSYGTANAKLKKMILFHMAAKLGENVCFQCGEIIDNINDFSIEHKVPWLDSDDPVRMFFDINNISFSHLKCNIRNARFTKPRKIIYEMSCSTCGEKFKRDAHFVDYWRREGQIDFYCSSSCARLSRGKGYGSDHKTPRQNKRKMPPSSSMA